jgi:hypothetical protein
MTPAQRTRQWQVRFDKHFGKHRALVSKHFLGRCRCLMTALANMLLIAVDVEPMVGLGLAESGA